MRVRAGRLVESFCFLPTIDLSWMWAYINRNEKPKRVYYLRFAWFFWYISTDNTGKELEKFK